LNGSFFVSLPSEFAREHGLTKGSVVRVWYNGDLLIEAIRPKDPGHGGDNQEKAEELRRFQLGRVRAR